MVQNLSKDIGICIINTDRLSCLIRLLISIQKYTSTKTLEEIKIHIVDDSSQPIPIIQSIKQFPFVDFIHTGTRIGVARNTNKALQLIKNKKYCLIFNNDCEVLHEYWLDFYYESSLKTNIHHFCFQQEGLWGAGTEKRPEERSVINGVEIKTIHNHPQGALLAFDKKAFDTAGYFDSKNFSSYGFSHWMWSFSISESNIQPKGIHDVIGSNKYFRVHNEKSCTDPLERQVSYKKNKEIFERELQKLKNQQRSIFTYAD